MHTALNKALKMGLSKEALDIVGKMEKTEKYVKSKKSKMASKLKPVSRYKEHVLARG